jgi:hypothetical protein
MGKIKTEQNKTSKAKQNKTNPKVQSILPGVPTILTSHTLITLGMFYHTLRGDQHN